MSTCALHSSAYLPQATSFALRLKWIHARRPRAGVQFWNRFRHNKMVPVGDLRFEQSLHFENA